MDIAIVTGASSGLGWEFVRQIDERYSLDEIWVVARREERLQDLSELVETPLRIFPLDLSAQESIQSIEQALKRATPHLKILVNNAGFGKRGTFQSIGLDSQLQMIDLNIRALVHLTYICIDYMDSGDQIIQLASSAGFLPIPNFTTYAASKAFVIHFSNGLAAELQQKGITVTAVCPGPVNTEFQKVAHENGPGEFNAIAPGAAPVVSKALRNAAGKRWFSLYGWYIKLLVFIVRLLPKKTLAKLSIRFNAKRFE